MKRFKKYSKGNSYIVIHNEKEDNHSKRSFYLRTGKTIEDVTSKAKKEFEKNINFEFNMGKFSIKENKIQITPNYTIPFAHLVVEGLFYNKYKNTIKTIRTPTKKLFNSVTGFITEFKKSDKNLIQLLTNNQKPAIVEIPGINPYNDFMKNSDYNKLAEGYLKSRRTIMNYGYLFNSATFIVDGDEFDHSSPWYILPHNPEKMDLVRNRHNQRAKLNEITTSHRFNFMEGDKVTTNLYFDGTVRDLIQELTKGEINLAKNLSLKSFSDN